MKHLLKTIAIGIITFLVIRFFLNVVQGGKSIAQSAKDTAMIPIQLIGTILGLAFQPDKWNTAGQIIRTTLINVKDSPGEMPVKLDEGFDALSNLVDAKPAYSGAEAAQYDRPSVNTGF